MIEKYFHINYDPREAWVLSIMEAVQNSGSTILQQRWKDAAQSDLNELPLALVTKFEIMKVTFKRLNDHIRELGTDFDERPGEVQRHIIGVDGQPSTYRPLKRELPFEIIVDIEALIFTLRSTYEMFYAFVKEFSSRILDMTVNSKRALKAIIGKKGYSTEWIDFLCKQRNYLGVTLILTHDLGCNSHIDARPFTCVHLRQ